MRTWAPCGIHTRTLGTRQIFHCCTHHLFIQPHMAQKKFPNLLVFHFVLSTIVQIVRKERRQWGSKVFDYQNELWVTWNLIISLLAWLRFMPGIIPFTSWEINLALSMFMLFHTLYIGISVSQEHKVVDCIYLDPYACPNWITNKNDCMNWTYPEL